MLQDKKLQIVSLDKANKIYNLNFSMNLDVVASKGDEFTCKISFKEKPQCIVFIEINKNEHEITCKFRVFF